MFFRENLIPVFFPFFYGNRDQSAAERARLGIKDNLVRFSCGIEDYQDILNDVVQSLDAL